MARVLQNRCPLSLSSQSDNPKLWKVSRSRGEAAAQSLETGGGRRGTGTWPRAVKAPRARQDKAGEYWPGSLQEAGNQAAEGLTGRRSRLTSFPPGLTRVNYRS